MPAEPLIIAAFSGLITWVGLFPLRGFLTRRQMLDIPNGRSSHVIPTPRGGGLLIVTATLVGCVAFGVTTASNAESELMAYVFGALLIAGVSWLDDVRSLPTWVRFVAHSLGAILGITAFGTWGVVDVPLWGQVSLGWIGVALTFVWIVGLTNAYNFMDGVDGMAAGQAVVAGIGWAILGWSQEQPLTTTIGLLLASTSCGFLGHNWSPAKIFMGDVGSTFLGYSFAILPLMAGSLSLNRRFAALTPVAGALLVWPFILDSGLTLLRRLFSGENVLAAHRSHLYQRLVKTDCSHRAVSVLYMTLAATGIGMSLSVAGSRFPTSDWTVITIALATMGTGLWVHVILREFRLAVSAQHGSEDSTAPVAVLPIRGEVGTPMMEASDRANSASRQAA